MKNFKVFVCGGFGLNEKKFFKPQYVENLSNFSISSIHCGIEHFGFLTNEKHLYTFGNNKRGQCGTSGYQILEPKKIDYNGFDEFSHFSCGREFSISVLSDQRTLLSSGSNDRSQLGIKTLNDHYGFQKVKEFNEDIKFITCGFNHSFVITKSHKVYAFGSNNYGEIGSGELFYATSPTELTSIYDQIKENCVQISSGLSHSLFLTESGKVYSVGKGFEGQLGINKKQSLQLQKVPIDDSIKSVYCGAEFSLALSRSGKLYLWGIGLLDFDALVRYKTGIISKDIDCSNIKILEENVDQVASGHYHCLFKKGEEIYGVGLGSDGQLGKVQEKKDQIVHINDMKSANIFACGGYTSFFAFSQN